MTTYTHYLPVIRHESGRISPAGGGWRKLGACKSATHAGVTEDRRVESIEHTVRGWGAHAEALGTVVGELRWQMTQSAPASVVQIPPVLAMLATIE